MSKIKKQNKEEKNKGGEFMDSFFEDDINTEDNSFEGFEEHEETAEEIWQDLKKQLGITDEETAEEVWQDLKKRLGITDEEEIEETDKETDKETDEETCEQTYDEAVEELFQEIEKEYTQCGESEETTEETDEDIDENYKNCYDCINKDCEFNLHGKKWIPDMDLPLFIGGLLADEIMSNACRNMIHIIEIKDALFSIEDEEIREEALDRVKMIKSNLCNTIELIHKAPDKVYEIV